MHPLYDTFLCQESVREDPFAVASNPEDRTSLLKIYQKSADYFAERKRIRAVERLQYEAALLHMQGKQWKQALKMLLPLWQNLSWRQAGWWHLLESVDLALRDCAREAGDASTLVAVEWELLSNCFTSQFSETSEFSKCLNTLDIRSPSLQCVIRANELVSCLCPSLAFGITEGNVGEPLPIQLIIRSRARALSAPIILSRLFIEFDGGLKDINIKHRSTPNQANPSSGNVELYTIDWDVGLVTSSASEISDSVESLSSSSLNGLCDLVFQPGCTKALSFTVLPRVAGSVKAKSFKLNVEGEFFDLDVITLANEQMDQDNFWVDTAKDLNRKNIGHGGRNTVRIQPKPPKVQITLPNFSKDYLTDEDFTLNIELFNGEDGAAEVDLEIRFLGEVGAVPQPGWISVNGETATQQSTGQRSLVDVGNKSLAVLSLGMMQAQEKRTLGANFSATSLPAEAVLEIKTLYRLLSASDTPLSKVSINDVVFYRPFEANYQFEPCIDPSIWPSYFNVNEPSDDGNAYGLKQRWRSTVKLASFAPEPLFIENIQMRKVSLQDGANCRIIDVNSARSEGTTLAPNDFSEHQFEIIAQKVELDDRRSTALELQLQVCWRRDRSGAASATTTLSVPRLVIPFGEPRVLAFARPLQNEPAVISLEYTIENPSTHVLNFDLSMDASEDFAFSGPKTTSVQLVPVSRHTVQYHLLPLARGIWIGPCFRVLDTYFNQVLKVYGTGGVRTDKKGISIWIDTGD